MPKGTEALAVFAPFSSTPLNLTFSERRQRCEKFNSHLNNLKN
jgi:hypothetical protein